MQDICASPVRSGCFTPAYETLLGRIRIISGADEVKGTQIWSVRDQEGQRGWRGRKKLVIQVRLERGF